MERPVKETLRLLKRKLALKKQEGDFYAALTRVFSHTILLKNYISAAYQLLVTWGVPEEEELEFLESGEAPSLPKEAQKAKTLLLDKIGKLRELTLTAAANVSSAIDAVEKENDIKEALLLLSKAEGLIEKVETSLEELRQLYKENRGKKIARVLEDIGFFTYPLPVGWRWRDLIDKPVYELCMGVLEDLKGELEGIVEMFREGDFPSLQP